MTRYILNYKGGTKGDFLCNFINRGSIDLVNNFSNKSYTNYGFFKFLWCKSFEELDIDLTELNNKNTKIFPAHFTQKIPTSFLIEHDLKIINLVYTKKYLKTIKIEALFKNATDTIYLRNGELKRLHKRLLIDKNDFSFARYNKFTDIKFQIDTLLFFNKIKINDINRCEFLDKELNEMNEITKKDLHFDERGYNIDYEDLYIKKDFNSLNQLFQFNADHLKDKIENTWLPSEITIWGKTWFPSNYGYRF